MRVTALVTTLLLTACAGGPPPTHTYYLLRAELPEQTTRVAVPARIGLRAVEVAPYLKQPGLVLATGMHQVRPARFHQWAEPLDAGLRRLLRAEISKALGEEVSADATQRAQWEYEVDVGIDQLHGNLSGEALLAASWRITRGTAAEEIARFRMSRSQPLARDGYAALVEAEIGLARQLAIAIAESLRQVGEEE